MANNSSKKGSLSNEVEAYLLRKHGSYSLGRLERVFSIVHNDPFKAKAEILRSIESNLSKYNREAVGSKISAIDLSELDSENFPNEFLKWSWKRRPFSLTRKDYKTILQSVKESLFIKGENPSSPVYKFVNDYNFKLSKKHKGEKHFNDCSFFTDASQHIAYGKVVNVQYKPISEKLISIYNKGKSQKERENGIYKPTLYNRSLSITLYVLLDGTYQKSHPVMRYDSSPFNHHNTYYYGDKRRGVYGEVAISPHFHFQNADDDLLCLKKSINSDKVVRWKTGRCNAIDCPHLIDYLLEIDRKSAEEIDRICKIGDDFNMPFIYFKQRNQYLSVPIKKILKVFMESENKSGNLSGEDREFIAEMMSNFNELYSQSELAIEPTENKIFTKLIKAINFLQYLYDRRKVTTNVRQLEILSNIEIEIADKVFNEIAGIEKSNIQKVNTKTDAKNNSHEEKTDDAFKE